MVLNQGSPGCPADTAGRHGWGGVDRARVAGIEQAEARDAAEPSVRHSTASPAAKEDPAPMRSVQRLANPGGFTGNLQVISDLTSKAMGVIFKGPADQKQNRYLGHTKTFFEETIKDTFLRK